MLGSLVSAHPVNHKGCKACAGNTMCSMQTAQDLYKLDQQKHIV